MRRPLLLVYSMLACALVFGVVAWLGRLPQMPRYKGRPLTDWVNDGYGTSATQEQLDQANEAVHCFGTNALEFWVRMLANTNDSILTKAGNGFFDRGSRFHRQDCLDRSWLAFCGLYILGADAKPAIPKLRELLEYRQTLPNAYATIILAGLGPEGVKTLTNVLADPKAQMRFYIAGTLGGWNGKPPNYFSLAQKRAGPWEWPEPVMQALVPALIRCLKDRDAGLRTFSAQSLGFLGKDAATSVPALAEYLALETNAFGRTIGLEALGRFGTAAQSTRAEIARYLEDSNMQTRRSATNALQKIDPKAAAQAEAR